MNAWMSKVTRFCMPPWPILLCLALLDATAEARSKDAAGKAYGFYFGNLHSHTSYSDGQSTPAHAFEYARDTAGVDFLAVTDHHGALSDSEYADVLFQADTYTQDGSFIAIAGQEWTSTDLCSHLNVFEADHVFKAVPNDFDSLYSELALSGCTATFNHPRSGCFFNYAYSATGDVGVNAVEVRNDMEQGWYIKILDKGWRVGADGSQDNHHPNWGDGPYWTAALACSLTKAEILEANRGHRTYSTWDRDLELTFQAEGHWMGEDFPHSDSISFFIDALDPNADDLLTRIELYQNGHLIAWTCADTNAIIWQPRIIPPNGQNYYFVKVHQADGDRAWSSPIWIQCTTSLPATPLLCSPPNEGTVTTPATTFIWHPSDQAETYTLQYSTADNFPDDSSTATIADIADTSWAPIENLANGGTYYWRAFSRNGHGSSQPSGIRHLYVDQGAILSSLEEIRLTTHPWEDVYPCIFQGSTKTWLAWTSWQMANDEIYCRTSSDAGLSWSSDIRLTNHKAADICPTIAEDENGKIWVAWASGKDGNHEIYYRIYDGASWSTASNLTQHPGEDITPCFFRNSDGLMWAVWSSNRADSNYELYLAIFDGNSWSAATRLTDRSTQDYCPRLLQMDGQEIWLVWHTWGQGCYLKIFDGSFWSDDALLLEPPAHYPSLARRADGQVVLAYLRDRWSIPGLYQWSGGIYYKTYQQGQWSEQTALSADPAVCHKWSSTACLSDGKLWVAYASIRDGNEDVYARRSEHSSPPEAIDDVGIILQSGAKSASGDIFLWWSEPYDDGGVLRYVIYRSAVPGWPGDSLAGTADTTYCDPGAAGTVGLNYFYVIKAVDACGQKSEPSEQVGEFDRETIGGGR